MSYFGGHRSVLTLALILLHAGSALGLTSRADTMCRRGLLFGERRLAYHIARQLGQCHEQRMKRHIPPSTDCNDLANLPFPKAIARIERSVGQLAKTQCRDASPPSALGFVSCPAPCAPTIRTYQDVARCLVCITREQARAAVEFTIGEPLVAGPNSRATRCVDLTATALRQYMVKRIEQGRRCAFLQDRGRVPASVDCRTADLNGALERGRQSAQQLISNCSAGARGEVGQCGSDDLQDVFTCFDSAVSAHTSTIIEAVVEP